MTGADVVLLVLGLTLAVALAARRIRTPMPVVLAAAGIALGAAWRLVPGLPPVRVPADRVLLVFLPPLLASAAYALPLGAFRRNLRPILLLAIGLVVVTMVAAGATAHVTAGLPWAAALLLGAVIAPPDPVAASAVAGETGLAHRLVVILEGEGLVNDAVAIVAYQLAVSAAATGRFSWGHAAVDVLRAAPTGVLVGLAIGWATVALRRRVDDVTLEAGISLLVPYITYEVADRIGASAVLAVVTLGFVFQRREVAIATPAARLAGRTVWGAVSFVSTALVFFLLGLLMGEVVSTGITGSLALAGLAVTGVAILIRLAWMYAVPSLTAAISQASRMAVPVFAAPTWRERTVLGWAGMRGVVSLALALALPPLPPLAGGGDTRRTILVLTLAVIMGTLILQGVTLLPLIARLGVGEPDRDVRDEARVRARARWAALAALARADRTRPRDGVCRAYGDLVANGTIGIAAGGAAHPAADDDHPLRVALDAQRTLVFRMRDAGRIGAGLAERLATEVDVDALRVSGEASRLTGAEDG